ncbi:MAG: hypothetical protein AAFV32_07635, partial [Myxococcota bacterium]
LNQLCDGVGVPDPPDNLCWFGTYYCTRFGTCETRAYECCTPPQTCPEGWTCLIGGACVDLDG